MSALLIKERLYLINYKNTDSMQVVITAKYTGEITKENQIKRIKS